MVVIHFASGKTHEFEYDWNNLAPKFQLGGIRMFKAPDGSLIPLNSHTIERIEFVETEEEIIADEWTEETVDINDQEAVAVAGVVEEINDADIEAEEEKPLTPDQKAALLLEEMKAKSECTHEGTTVYVYSDSSVGKGRKPIRRYRTQCTNCGVIGKFIKSATLTDEEKLNAKEYVS